MGASMRLRDMVRERLVTAARALVLGPDTDRDTDADTARAGEGQKGPRARTPTRTPTRTPLPVTPTDEAPKALTAHDHQHGAVRVNEAQWLYVKTYREGNYSDPWWELPLEAGTLLKFSADRIDDGDDMRVRSCTPRGE
jgi:hypothetical protein